MTAFSYDATLFRVHSRQWLRALILGIAIGSAVLGVGGRVAMRGITVANGQAGGFSLGGTLTVVFLGAVSGAAGGLILALAHQFFSRRPWVRGLLFWTALLLLTLRGLRPLEPLAAAFFMPLVALYGILMEIVWTRAPDVRSAKRSV